MPSSFWWSSVLKVIVLYIGAVIGAGFASGQEILQFFMVFGSSGLLGTALAAGLFAYLGGLVMYLSVTSRTANYIDLYRLLMGQTPRRLMDGLSMVMLPAGVLVMLAGGGAVFSEHLGLPGLLGTLLTAAVTAAVIFRGLPGVVSANAVLVPVKMSAIVVICLLALLFSHPSPEGLQEAASSPPGARVNWVWSAVLYVSYNMVVPAAVLSSLGRSVPLRAGVVGGALGGLALGGAAGLVAVTGLCFYPGVAGYEVPLLYIAGTLGPVFKALLGALIWVAILTTAIADTHGFASRFAGSRSRKYRAMGAGVVLLALPLSTLKFSLLVRFLYPLFGYAGLILLAALLFVPPAYALRRKLGRTV